jgi:cobyrinic acid a,c-diamide synthase
MRLSAALVHGGSIIYLRRAMTKSLLVAGARSGCGKTSLTLGLLAALSRRGLRVAPFKTGPDFIDPGLHELACARESHNLDSWMLSGSANRDIFARNATGADVAVIEGAMGLFDGAGGASEEGSAAHMAKLLGAPVVLTLDASGMGRSAAAMAQGYVRFDPALSVAGVVLNRVGSDRHAAILRQALDAAGIAVLGCLRRDAGITIPSRHLGLHAAHDMSGRPGFMDALADWVEAGMDLDGLLDALPVLGFAPFQAAPAPGGRGRFGAPGERDGKGAAGESCALAGLRLGVARDRAFSFCYHENLRLLESAGAELVFFSPLDGDRLPEGLSGLYLPGGYPELHAAELSANAAMLKDIRDFCLSGRPALAECGGFMALMDSIRDVTGAIHPMAGVFGCQARMGERFAALGYREVRLIADTPLGPAGTAARGHEFHYSSLMGDTGAPAVYALSGREGAIAALEGFLAGKTLGSYVHLHFASNPEMAGNFVRAMANASGGRP